MSKPKPIDPKVKFAGHIPRRLAYEVIVCLPIDPLTNAPEHGAQSMLVEQLLTRYLNDMAAAAEKYLTQPRRKPMNEVNNRIDLDDLRRRILGVRSGALQPDAYTDAELRQAIEQIQEDRRSKAAASTPSRSLPKETPTAITAPAGSLLSLLNQKGES